VSVPVVLPTGIGVHLARQDSTKKIGAHNPFEPMLILFVFLSRMQREAQGRGAAVRAARDLVFQRRNAQWPLHPIRFRNVMPPHWRRDIASGFDARHGLA
jgi:hypothetical protein